MQSSSRKVRHNEKPLTPQVPPPQNAAPPDIKPNQALPPLQSLRSCCPANFHFSKDKKGTQQKKIVNLPTYNKSRNSLLMYHDFTPHHFPADQQTHCLRISARMVFYCLGYHQITYSQHTFGREEDLAEVLDSDPP
jgi:hypothetical protein